MDVEFDPDKDAVNIAKHGVSLAAGALFEVRAIVLDDRVDYGEDRFNAFGLIDDFTYCLTFTWRGTKARAISLRRARLKEYRRHVF